MFKNWCNGDAPEWKKIKQKLGRENQPKWNLAERLSWDLFHMMLFDSASTWVNTCLRHLWVEPEISELETGCTCLWPRQFRVVLTPHSRRSERWSWQHATPVCRLQILQEGQSSGLSTSWWRCGSAGLAPIAAFHMKWPKRWEFSEQDHVNLHFSRVMHLFYLYACREQTDSVTHVWEALRDRRDLRDRRWGMQRHWETVKLNTQQGNGSSNITDLWLMSVCIIEELVCVLR